MKSTRYHTVSYQEAQANRDYANVVENIFYETGTRLIQRWWRKKKHIPNKKASYPSLQSDKLAIRFLKEPLDDGPTLFYAEKIQSGQWKELNFTHPDCIRHLYKALRQGRITSDQLGTALLLHEAKALFQNPIIQYTFHEKGPYLPRNISYMTLPKLMCFNRLLEDLPKEEQVYFSINLTHTQVINLLSTGLDRKLKTMKFRHFLTCYAVQNKLEIAALKGDFLREREEWNIDFLYLKPLSHRQDVAMMQASIDLLLIILQLNEQLPFLEISPDFDRDNPNSPLLCMIILSLSAFKALEKTLHGKDSTYPFLTAGHVSTRFLRHLDELYQARPVEITHPDLVSNDNIHGFNVYPFLLTWHDLLHTWRNGANMDKDMWRYMRGLLEQEKCFPMSKSIWALVDMDASVGRLRRDALLNPENKHACKYISFYILLHQAGDKFWQTAGRRDHNLLLMIDMIIHPNQWRYFSQEIHAFFKNPHDMQRMKVIPNEDVQLAQEDFQLLTDIIAQDKTRQLKPTSSLYMHYILLYRLRGHINKYLLSRNLDKMGTHTLLKWDRNGGLRFDDGRAIENMGIQQLYEKLVEKARTYLASRYTFFSRPQPVTNFNASRTTSTPAPGR